jgi:hypothetical protein
LCLLQVSWTLQRSVADTVSRLFLIPQKGVQIQVSPTWCNDTIITPFRQLSFISIVKG